MTTSVEQVFSARKPPGVAEAVVRVRSRAAPDAVWALLATPARWPAWAPHITRAVVDGGQADAEVAEGARLRVHGPRPVVVDAVVVLVERGARWDFVVDLPGPWSLTAAHAVRATRAGSEVATRLRAGGPGTALGGRAALAAYAPLARLALTRLARQAAASSARGAEDRPK